MNRHPVPTSRPPLRSVLALFTAGVLALAACGGDDDSSPDAADAPGDTTSDATHDTASHATTPSDDAAPTGTNEIVIDGFAFSGVTEVPVGTTVIVVNQDTAAHTWTAIDGSFDSGGLAPGDTFEFTFEAAGTFDYRCNIHTSMTGTIVVTP